MRKDFTLFLASSVLIFKGLILIFQMSLTGLYVGSVLVVLDMSLTILALVLNLAVVIGLRYMGL